MIGAVKNHAQIAGAPRGGDDDCSLTSEFHVMWFFGWSIDLPWRRYRPR
jgi:hypothetical protein